MVFDSPGFRFGSDAAVSWPHLAVNQVSFGGAGGATPSRSTGDAADGRSKESIDGALARSDRSIRNVHKACSGASSARYVIPVRGLRVRVPSWAPLARVAQGQSNGMLIRKQEA
jgi:hypothetical protein